MSLVIPSVNAGSPGCTVAEDVFGREFNESLVHQLVVSYLAGGRSGTKAQKTRSEVSGGGAKPWKQKGSGRARAGTTRSPIWRSGGVTFAAKPRSYEVKLNKKMYRSGLKSILSELLRQNRIVICDDLNVDEPKTKAFKEKLANLGFEEGLVLIDEFNENIFLSARNLKNIVLRDIRSVSPVDLVSSAKVMMTSAAAKSLEGSLS